jgi:hypothetical protein
MERASPGNLKRAKSERRLKMEEIVTLQLGGYHQFIERPLRKACGLEMSSGGIACLGHID